MSKEKVTSCLLWIFQKSESLEIHKQRNGKGFTTEEMKEYIHNGNMNQQEQEEDILRGMGSSSFPGEKFWSRVEDTATGPEQQGGVTPSVNSIWGTKH